MDNAVAPEVEMVARLMVKLAGADPDEVWPKSKPEIALARWRWRVTDAIAIIAAMDASRKGGV